MKINEIVQKSDKEIAVLVDEKRKQLSDVLIDMRTKQISNVKQVAAIKKTIAQLLTVQNQRKLTKKEEANG